MKELNFTVDKEKCTKCGLCKSDCLVNIIDTDSEGFPQVKNSSACIGCQHCFAICPTGAISVFGKNTQDSSDCKDMPNSVQLENLIKMRRSCRQFKQENIDKETLQKLKNILNYAPTGVNYRGLHFTIVDSMDKMSTIKELLYKKLKFILKFVPLSGRLKGFKDAVLADKDVVFRNAPHMIVVSADKSAPCADIDPVIALSYFEMYAQTLGIGTLWCGFAFKTLPLSKEVMKIINIPKNYKLSYVMLFGYPKVKYQRSVQPESYEI